MKQCILQPIITEKSLRLASQRMYTFKVNVLCTKTQIAREIEALFSVDVINTQVMSMHGKMRRVGRRMKPVKKPDWKKAIVTLKEGQSIEVFEVSPEGTTS